MVLFLVGWLVWSLLAFRRGQTPAKQLLSMRTIRPETGRRASWGRMFLRELVAKPLVAVLAVLTLGLVLLWPLWDDRRQALWDKIAGTIVVDDRYGQLEA